jgi:hypothetical protein
VHYLYYLAIQDPVDLLQEDTMTDTPLVEDLQVGSMLNEVLNHLGRYSPYHDRDRRHYRDDRDRYYDDRY